jgi:hypothetical protein
MHIIIILIVRGGTGNKTEEVPNVPDSHMVREKLLSYLTFARKRK